MAGLNFKLDQGLIQEEVETRRDAWLEETRVDYLFNEAHSEGRISPTDSVRLSPSYRSSGIGGDRNS